MARDFPNSVSDYLGTGTSFVANTEPRPISVACWYKADVNDIPRHWLLNNNFSDQSPRLGLAIQRVSGTTHKMALYSGGYKYGSNFPLSTDAWIHYGWTWDTDGSVAFYRTGSPDGVDTISPGGNTSQGAAIGTLDGLFSGFLLDGQLAGFGVWNGILTSGDFAALAAGVCPLLVRPEELVAYLPLGGIYGRHDRDLVGDYHMTAYGGPTWAEHPSGLYYPDGTLVGIAGGAAGPNLPVFDQHYRRLRAA